MPTPTKTAKAVKLRKIKIHDFKVLDSLELDFPGPRMDYDLDIFVLGSKNGLGKTSVLECCALLHFVIAVGEKPFSIIGHRDMPVDLFDLLVRAGKKEAVIEGTFLVENKPVEMSLSFGRGGAIRLRGDTAPFKGLWERSWRDEGIDVAERFLFSLMGMNSDPLILPPFMYFHSYRKVQEGNPELAMMVESRRPFRRTRPGFMEPVSAFKLELLRSMMSQASLFENIDDQKDRASFEKLDELVERYAGGKITKLRALADNTVDFRITAGRDSFTFDGLSSGQKEIISTLYLIWRHTRQAPGIILIDEPELHLNYEWQNDFIQQLHMLAPNNQYILATHSEEIFASAPDDHRILLVPGEAKA
jgi:predicted ATPase